MVYFSVPYNSGGGLPFSRNLASSEGGLHEQRVGWCAIELPILLLEPEIFLCCGLLDLGERLSKHTPCNHGAHVSPGSPHQVGLT